jgi:hypothetical protein
MVQAPPHFNSTRRVRINTVKFDVECVYLFNSHTDGVKDYAVFSGLAFKKSDVSRFLLPHQMVMLSRINNDNRLNYISVVPYSVSFSLPHSSEIDPNLTTEINNDDVPKSPDDERTNEVEHYKHHAMTIPFSETCISISVGDEFASSLGNYIFYSSPAYTSYQWSWFPQGPIVAGTRAIEEMVIIPIADLYINSKNFYTLAEAQTIVGKVNLGYAMPDWAMRDAIYSNYQVIRGNEYGSRESIIDYPVED